MNALPRWLAATGVVVVLVLGRAGHGQVAAPEVDDLARQMAEMVRHLGEDIDQSLGNTPRGPELLRDTNELAEAVDDFRATLARRPDPSRLRRVYGGIDSTWHHLRSLLDQPEVARAGVLQAAARVDELDARLHRALGLNELPANYYGAAQAPEGVLESRRLAHALETRAFELASAVQSELAAAPDGGALVERATDLARATDRFHDALAGLDRPDVVQNAFAPVAAVADQLEQELGAVGATPRVQAAWQSFAAAEALLRQHLGLPTPPPAVAVNLSPAAGTPSPVLALADTLIGQVDAFLDAFSTNAGNVPQGALILADAQRLRAAAAGFRQDAARGLNPAQLAYEFRDVDYAWQVLARRINRVARGRTGPNIQVAMQVGQTVDQIHRVLGMPGYAPVVAMPGAPPPP